MSINLKKIKILDVNGKFFPQKYTFRRIPYINLYIFRKLLNKKVLNLNIFKSNLKIFSKLKKFKMIQIYNGKIFKLFLFNKLKLFRIIGEFIFTRIIKSGNLLHLRKKQKTKNIKKN